MGDLNHREENNIKADLKEGGCESVDWIHMPQEWIHYQAFVKTNRTLGSIKGGEVLSRMSASKEGPCYMDSVVHLWIKLFP
jgi:hypothetical protein